jgi:o-succinylbenzoate synthase
MYSEYDFYSQLSLPAECSLDRLEIIVVELPLVERFRSAVGLRETKKALYARWFDTEGNWGIGECACRADPFYSAEFLSGSILVIKDFIFALLPERFGYNQLASQLNRVRGWNFTVSSIEAAFLDLWRRRGLEDPVASWGQRVKAVPAGISLGLYESADKLIERIDAAVSSGYRRIKLKVEPGVPSRVIIQARDRFPDLKFHLDANGSFNEKQIDELVTLAAAVGPLAIEQPFSPDRLDLFCHLKERQPELRICLDESVTSMGDLIIARKIGVIDELNIKLGRVGGLLRSLQVVRYCAENDIPAWVGGMFETGIGRAANLRLASCLPSATAHDLSPSNRYFEKDVLAESLVMNADGFIMDFDDPVTLNEEFIARHTIQKVVLQH